VSLGALQIAHLDVEIGSDLFLDPLDGDRRAGLAEEALQRFLGEGDGDIALL
jgi:hypothetical protein